ncbi:MAG TPA: bi-domain-containing oxidoreductase [Pyrinomonadaceae bacterium]|nr:bi-domain-containing oxidoreductase [Pyrinomonadaceae bacterium]
MKQILQNYKTGEVSVADVPPPIAQRGRVLVRTAASLISAGTERMAVELGRKSLIGKARERPDLVRQVIRKAQREGLMNTLTAVQAKLNAANALGYSAAGIVVGVGDDVTAFSAGDRVACAGAGFASHAEVLSVPKNLCVRLPAAVDFEAAAFGTLGAIALQGVRLAEPTLGESVVVIGLGLLGQLTVQLLKANGCRVFGLDLDAAKVALARTLGADDAAVSGGETLNAVMEWTRGRGADAVLITAATSSDQPVELAGEMSRLKGRVVAVGLVGMNVPRKIYYERELTLKVSMSYGPGRYDPEYEERGHDYPFAYVRWTEGRNLEAFLDLVAAGSVRLAPLITHRFSIADGERAYNLIAGETKEPYLGIVLNYDMEREIGRSIERRAPGASAGRAPSGADVRLGLIGAGSYAQKFLLPNFKANGAAGQSIATASGISAHGIGEKYDFARVLASAEEVIADAGANLIVIATRHDSHAPLARRALEAGRHVFVEKPLALNDEELDGVLAAARASEGQLMVGYNRRFSPHARACAEAFAARREPLSILYRVNAGRIPRTHWIQDPREGGGRIIGEVCHFIDLMHFLTGAVATRVYAERVAGRNEETVDEDSIVVTLRFSDGSNGQLAYLAEGDRALAKERIEIFGGGKTFVIEDFRSATLYERGRERPHTKLRAQDKGQAAEVRAVCEMVRANAPAPIALHDLAATTRATFRIRDSLRTGQPMEVTGDG